MDIPAQIFEGPRIEINVQDKMKTNLEHNLSKSPRRRSVFSPCPSPDSKAEKRNCGHYKLVSEKDYNTCFHCGIYVPKNGVKSFKLAKMNYQPFFSAKSIYEAMTRRSYQFTKSLNPEYSLERKIYAEEILEIAAKLKISYNASHLAIFLLDFIMYRNIALTQKLDLYAPVCLLIATKTIEHDSKIPFISQLRRYADSSFSVEDYRKAELQVLDLVDWNAQFSSALEITEFLLCQGILFSSDEIAENSNLQEGVNPTSSVLKEKALHENKNHIDASHNTKKESSRNWINTLLSNTKENYESPDSDHSTSRTNTDNISTLSNIGVIDTQQAEERSSPLRIVPVLIKHKSTPNIEIHTSVLKQETSIEKNSADILAYFETSYMKLSTLVVRDIDFIEWEPKVISAATIAFMRNINKVTPTWTPELETITHLKLSQFAACFELMNQKYTFKFSASVPKLQIVSNASDANKNPLAELKMVKSNNASDKNLHLMPKFELQQKPNSVNGNYTKPATTGKLVEQNTNIAISSKVEERKPIFSSLAKNTITVPNAPSTTLNYPKNELLYQTKYPNGTINTELPLRNLGKNPIFAPKLQHQRHNSNYDNVRPYSSNVVGVPIGTGLTSARQYCFPSENYLINDLKPYTNPPGLVLTQRTASSIETGRYQPKIGMYRK